MAVKIIKVPDVPGPEGICWKQDIRTFQRCTKKTHGPDATHSWEEKRKK